MFKTPRLVVSSSSESEREVDDIKPLHKRLQELSIESNVKPNPKAIKEFQNDAERLAKEMYQEYNEHVFENQLPVDLPIIWNKHMRKTAGFAYAEKYRLNLLNSI